MTVLINKQNLCEESIMTKGYLGGHLCSQLAPLKQDVFQVCSYRIANVLFIHSASADCSVNAIIVISLY